MRDGLESIRDDLREAKEVGVSPVAQVNSALNTTKALIDTFDGEVADIETGFEASAVHNPGDAVDLLDAVLTGVEPAMADEEMQAIGNVIDYLRQMAEAEGRFEVYQDSADEWRWRLVHRNGNIIADSGQGYASKQKAKQGLRSVQVNAPGGTVWVPDGRVEAPEEDSNGG